MAWTDWMGALAFVVLIVTAAVLRRDEERAAERARLERKWRP